MDCNWSWISDSIFLLGEVIGGGLAGMIGMDPKTSAPGQAIEKAGNAIGGAIGNKVSDFGSIAIGPSN